MKTQKDQTDKLTQIASHLNERISELKEREVAAFKLRISTKESENDRRWYMMEDVKLIHSIDELEDILKIII